MAKLNRTCIVCREKYSYCVQCHEDVNKPSWHVLFCSDNCKNIYDFCTAFRDGKSEHKEAKDKLSTCDLSKFDNMSESTQNIINKIMSYVNVKDDVKDDTAEQNENVTENVAVNDVEENVEKVIEETPVVLNNNAEETTTTASSTTYTRKKRNRSLNK